MKRVGRYTISLETAPKIAGYASVVGKRKKKDLSEVNLTAAIKIPLLEKAVGKRQKAACKKKR